MACLVWVEGALWKIEDTGVWSFSAQEGSSNTLAAQLVLTCLSFRERSAFQSEDPARRIRSCFQTSRYAALAARSY